MKRIYIGGIVTIVACVLMAMVPFLYLHSATGMFLPNIIPEIESDSAYYLVQIDEVLSGRWLLGNPYFMEYGNGRSPAILLPIVIASLPGIFGFSINMVFAINVFLYTIVTGLLFYALLASYTKGNEVLRVILSILGTGYVHNLIVRPAIMQTIFPTFLLFLLALLLYLENPSSGKRMLSIILTTALSFYMYLHLWMTAFTMLGLVFLWSVYKRNQMFLRSFFVVIPSIVLLCALQITWMITDWNDPIFADIAYRTGITSTHVVRALTLFNLKYVLLSFGMLLLLYRKRVMPTTAVVVLLGSIALVIAATSNVMSGIELDFPSHFWRLSLIIVPLAIACFVHIAWKEQSRRPWEKVVAGACALLLFATAFNHAFVRANGFPYIRSRSVHLAHHQSLQKFDPVLRFLNSLTPTRQVILTGGDISAYVPLYTDHTVLYYGAGRYNIISSDELQERFLIQHVDYIDDALLSNNVRDYVGFGPLREREYAQACQALPFCRSDPPREFIEYMGGASFLQEKMALHKKIDHEYEERLAKFKVSLIISDNEYERLPRIPPNAVKIYEDGRFTVWKI